MPLVGLATCRNLPEADVDAPLLDKALAAHGVTSQLLAWDDDAVDWASLDVCVIRSTWNYIHRADEFLAWVERVSKLTRIYNPARIVRTNAHKSYLTSLAEAGVPTVETAFVPRGERKTLGEIVGTRGWPVVVVKPAVSAGSFATRRFCREELDEAWFEDLVRARDVMVQPYVSSVEGYGERSIVWIDGELTHAIRKSPRFDGGHEAVSERLPIADDEAALALSVLSPMSSELLYGRVDMARSPSGKPMVMELELIEPSLFLVQHPPAADRLAHAIAKRL